MSRQNEELSKEARAIIEDGVKLCESNQVIADKLNHKQLLTPRGKEWNQGSVDYTIKARKLGMPIRKRSSINGLKGQPIEITPEHVPNPNIITNAEMIALMKAKIPMGLKMKLVRISAQTHQGF